MNKTEATAKLRELAREIDFFENTIMTLSWDMRVNLPLGGTEYRGNTIGFLSMESLRRQTSDEMREALETLEQLGTGEDEVLSAMVRKFRRDYDRLTEVPATLLSEYAAHNLKTEVMWQEARKKNDYESLRPFVEKEFDFKRKIASCHGFEKDPLTGLMDEWEPGVTRPVMDKLFEELKAFELPLLEKMKASPAQPDTTAYFGHYPREKQAAFCHELLEKVGFDFTKGRMDESVHPYTTANDPNDIRFTNHFHEEDFTRAALSTMHEGGHALHAQNASPKLRYTTLESMHAAGVCESQSRFLENFIGRSLPFWEFALPIACKYFDELRAFTPEQFYRMLNGLHISTNRLKADEFSYNLHILLRYELEKMLFDGDISFKEAPYWWNRKTEEYLGLVPENDVEGILQDMHWFSGYIGYFHTYVVGNFYDGHYYDAMIKDIPDLDAHIRKGDFAPVIAWQKQKVQQYGGMYSPQELLRNIDGEALSAKHYIAYAERKFPAIYGL